MKKILYINDIPIGEIATEWEDLSSSQYIAAVNNLYNHTQENIIESKIQMIIDTSNLKWFKIFRCVKTKWRKPFLLKSYFIDQFAQELMPLVDYIYDANIFDKNPIPVIQDNLFRKYYGPADKLVNIRAEEFEKIEYFNAHWHESGNISDLQALCGILYRRKSNSNNLADIREEYSVDKIEIYKNNMKSVNVRILKAIHLWYEMCLRRWQKEYDHIFPKSKNDKEPIIDPEAWRKILRALVGTKLGDKEQVNKSFLSDIYFELEQLEIERINLKK